MSDFPLGTAVAFRGRAYTVVGRRRVAGKVNLILNAIDGSGTVWCEQSYVSEVGSADAENTAVDEGWVPALPDVPHD